MLAIVYSDGTQECQRAIALMNNLEQKYIEYKLDRDFTIRQFVDEFGPSASFPQIAIGTKHVGSLKEALNYYKDKGLL